MIIYQYLVRNLMYLVYEIRLDIASDVKHFSKHNSDLQAGHVCIVKQTLQYLKKMSSIGIV